MLGFGGSKFARYSALAQMSSSRKSSGKDFSGLRKRLLAQTLCACVIFGLIWGLFHIQGSYAWLRTARQAVRESLTAHYDVKSVIRFVNDVGLWGDALERETLDRLSVPASGQMERTGTDTENPEAVLIFAEEGSAVRAVDDGEIRAVGEDPELGLWLELRTADGKMAKYGHCKDILVREGETVDKGQVVARVGQTGAAASPRLYFLLTQEDQAVDVIHLYSGG
jgi:murein DD-endopeptidase MepM/ murein hydrolase activator NlpD